MKRSIRGRGLAAVLVGATLVLAGCSATNPATTATPYAASDGSNAEIDVNGTTLKLRNFLLVGTGKDKPGVLVGAIANSGAQPITVTFTVIGTVNGNPAPMGSGTVTAAPGGLTLVGPGGADVTIASLPGDPGVVLQLRADTPAGGQSLNVPVLPTSGPYASVSPGVVASASPSA